MKTLDPKLDIFLSLSDLWQTVMRGKWKILCAALLCSFCFFYHQLKKPVSYSAEGVFKDSSSSGGGMGGVLGMLEGKFSSSFFSASLDAKTLLVSQPVIEKVIEKLHLQGQLADTAAKKSHFPKLRTIGRSLAAEWNCYHYRKKGRVPSRLSKDAEHAERGLCLKKLTYTHEISSSLSIVFKDDLLYSVFDHKGNSLGEGKLYESFHWKHGSFILANEGSQSPLSKKFTLSLGSMQDALKGLQQRISISVDKKNPMLVQIKIADADRHFAALLVNTLMQAHQDYLTQEAERKVSKQLDYLGRRQNETIEGWEKIIESTKKSLIENLGEGTALFIEKEIEFMAKRQVECRQILSEVLVKMKQIDDALHEKSRLAPTGLSELVSHLRNHPHKTKAFSPEFQGLTYEAANTIYCKYHEELDIVQFKIQESRAYLSHLTQPGFDFSGLASFLEDPVLGSVFSKINDLQLSLCDSHNTSTREQSLHLEDLEIQKAFIASRLNQFGESMERQEKLLFGKIQELQEILLDFYLDEHDRANQALHAITVQMQALPEKWFSEEKLKFHTHLYTKMFEAITNLIETKNISYNLESVEAYPFLKAVAPLLPNSPRLMFFAKLGACVGAFLCLSVLLLKALFDGASASETNLKAAGYPVAGTLSLNRSKKKDNDLLQKMVFTLPDKKIILFSSQKPSPILFDFLDLLAKKRGHGLLLAPPTLIDDSSLKKGEYCDSLSFTYSDIASAEFRANLQKLKEKYHWIVLVNPKASNGFETEVLFSFCDLMLLIVTEEKLSDLTSFVHDKAKETLFIVQKMAEESELVRMLQFLHRQKREIRVHLRHLEPLLEKLMKRMEKSSLYRRLVKK